MKHSLTFIMIGINLVRYSICVYFFKILLQEKKEATTGDDGDFLIIIIETDMDATLSL